MDVPPLISGTAGLVVAAALALVVLGYFVLVVVPAVWSKNEARKKDAQEVLRILRRK